MTARRGYRRDRLWAGGVVLAWLCVAVPASAATQRFALIASSNDGGVDRILLRYADDDARRMAEVLTELGGVPHDQALLLPSVRLRQLRRAIDRFGQRLQQARAPDQRVEVLFYYSGHADERGLLLAGQRMPYRELRQRLSAWPADVRVAIVDACASGGLTRSKGGHRLPPFLVDRATQVKGLAILTSSSETEVSQESDRLGGSFFTYYLVSALRGAADGDGDGRVTLGEAYRFTFARTLARTENSQAGAQHPSYDMQLAGTGDLVLTDLRRPASMLVLAPELRGRVWVRGDDGRLAVELLKDHERPIELALAPGSYRVLIERGGDLRGAELDLNRGAQRQINAVDLQPVDREFAVARGVSDLGGYAFIPVELSLLPRFSTNGVVEERAINIFSLSLLAGHAARLYGLGIGLLAHWVREQVIGMQLSLGANIVEGGAIGLQLAGLTNLLGGSSRALQLSLAANLSAAHLDVGQLSLGANLAGGDLRGLQAPAAFNLVAGRLAGAQLGLGFNVVGLGVSGVQLAPGGNLARGPVDGAQLALLGVNLAQRVRGAQLGAVNIAGDISGVQIGLVNIADEVRGAQLGLVNISDDMSGAPLGLVNVVGKGMLHGQVFTDDSALLNVSLLHGSRRVYSMITVGVQPMAEPLRVQLGVASGLRFRPDPAWQVDLDLGLLSLHRGRPTFDRLDLQPRLRALLGYKLLPFLSFKAGLSLNLLLSQVDQRPISAVPGLTILDDPLLVHLWPGLMLGVEI